MAKNATDMSSDRDDYALYIATFYSSQLNNNLILAALSTVLFGVSTICSSRLAIDMNIGFLSLLTGAAIYCLMFVLFGFCHLLRHAYYVTPHSRRGMNELATKPMLGCTLLLYLSTAVYWVSIVQSIAGYNSFLDLAIQTLASDSPLPTNTNRNTALAKNTLVINASLIVNVCSHTI